MADVLINGTRQGWGDIEVMLLGRQVTGITEISVSTEQEKGNEMGQGREPVHRSRGNKKYEGSIKMYKYEVDAILALLKEGQDLTDVAPFTLVVMYTPIGDDILKKLIVPMCEFTSMKHASKAGDKNLEVDLPMVIGKPIWNKQ